MKKILFLIPTILFCEASAFSDANADFISANDLYAQQKYEDAAEAYEKILENEFQSAELYFNLGNAYYQLNDIAPAILNYERAKFFSPSDRDILYNLRLANLRTIDKVEAEPEIFISRWWKNFLYRYNSNEWTWKGIFAFWLAFVTGVVFLFIRSSLLRRITFFISAALLLFAVIFFSFGFHLNRVQAQHKFAIIFTPNVYVKSAPDSSSADQFILHEGLKVNLQEEQNNWVKVKLEDGKVGWIEKKSLVEI